MSTTDARGHKVPEGTDPAARQSLLDLSLSIPSIIAVTSQTAAARYVAALAAAGVPVSEEHPVYVWRSDISAMLVWDGTKWAGTGGLTIETQQVGDTGLPYAAPAPNEIMLIKTGRLSSSTTNQFGNGYLPAVKFRAPFPRACLTVTVTPIYRNSSPWFFTDTRAPMIDIIDRTGFRAMYPGETTSVNHSIMWQAIGY